MAKNDKWVSKLKEEVLKMDLVTEQLEIRRISDKIRNQMALTEDDKDSIDELLSSYAKILQKISSIKI